MYTLTSVQHYENGKDGSPLRTKDGKPYTRCVIKLVEYGDKLVSGFGSVVTKSWRENDKIDIVVEEKGQYLNFSVPKKEDKLLHEINSLKIRMGKLENQVALLSKKEPRDFAEEMAMLEDSPFPDEPR